MEEELLSTLRGREACAVLDTLVVDEAFARSVICVVGAGLSGIEAAKIFSKDEPRPVLVLEKGDYIGGVWVRAANIESRVQVDPVSFAPIEDPQPVREPCVADVFDTMARPRAEVLKRLAEDARGLNIAFRTEVLWFEVLPASVRVRLLLRNGAVVQTEVAQLHVRTGCLDVPIASCFPRAEVFRGRLAAGVGSDVALADFANKRVVIVGMGAFAVENVRRALQGGAATITMVARSYKPLFPEYATYQLRRKMAETAMDDYDSFVKMWRNVHQILSTGAHACGAEAISLNEETVRLIDGEPSILFANGVPPMSCNTLLLALGYGACHIVRGTVASFTEDGVTLSSGRTLGADMVVLCLGFRCNIFFFFCHLDHRP
jgi:cation diffusion facilitator CzcD-associated flavoprotein CzcO